MIRVRGLRARLTWWLVGIAAGILVLASALLLWQTHYHVGMYRAEMYGMSDVAHEMAEHMGLEKHLELALMVSIIGTLLGAVLLAVLVSYAVSRRITAPLLDMQRVAERMAEGDLEARVGAVGRADELAELGSSLNRLAEQLQREEVLRKNMTADVAHELRTPLATLKSHMEAFEDGVWEPTPPRLHAVSEEIERLIRLVGDLEDLTRLESPEFQLTMVQQNLQDVVAQAVEAVRAGYVQKGVALTIPEEDNDWVEVRCDRERMLQVLHNVLSNALKYTPAGGEVQVMVHNRPEVARITVRDTGIGLTADQLVNVFERFYRADPSRDRKRGGSGIGLAIVKRLVEAHGGRVWMESAPDVGTTVYIELPSV